MTRRLQILIALVLIAYADAVDFFAQNRESIVANDSLATIEADSLAVESSEYLALETDSEATVCKKNVIQKISDYFKHSNHFDPSKKIDFGIIGGPFYASDTGVGVGLVASGLYLVDRSDETLPISNISLYANVATSGMLAIGVKGNNVFPHEKYKLDYSAYFYTFPSKIWGIGYTAGDDDNNEHPYSRIKIEAKPRFLFRLFDNAFFGPVVNVQYVKVTELTQEVIDLVGSRDKTFLSIGGGLSLNYDSRDVITNATRGWYVQLDQLFFPGFFGNEYKYTKTDLTICTYKKAWKGAVIAGEFHSQLNFQDVPWPMLACVGGPSRMRGYYEGRYRDKCIMEAQVELRQHICRRNGIAVWVGAANVFPKFEEMRWKYTLPNFGVGYRWAFKQGVNVRIDLGVTKNGIGFAFNINEAF